MTIRKQRSRKIRRRAGASVQGSPWGGGDPTKPRDTAPREARPRRHSPEPTAEGLWLYGHHAVSAALANPARRCHRLIGTTQAIESLHQSLGDDLGRHDDMTGDDLTGSLPVTAASRGEVGALLTEGAVHQGVAMEVSALPATALDAVCHPDATSRLVVLDRVNDPQNLGAVLRVAAAFEASAVIVPDRHAPGESGALAKAASGTLEIVPLVRVPNVAQALERLKQDGYWCIGLDGGAANTIAQSRPAGATALVLGAEGDGLRRLTRERCDALARLPISDKVESLNLATAAAVALYALTNDA
ncbi:MAG: RNA methyltransferase [Alphaproteobacteria bacterium]